MSLPRQVRWQCQMTCSVASNTAERDPTPRIAVTWHEDDHHTLTPAVAFQWSNNVLKSTGLAGSHSGCHLISSSISCTAPKASGVPNLLAVLLLVGAGLLPAMTADTPAAAGSPAAPEQQYTSNSKCFSPVIANCIILKLLKGPCNFHCHGKVCTRLHHNGRLGSTTHLHNKRCPLTCSCCSWCRLLSFS